MACNSDFVQYVIDQCSGAGEIAVRKVMDVCKANNCTPSILMTILMQKGVKSVNPDAAEQILCSMSCDWRESIGLPNTFRNCVSSIYLPYGAEEQEMGMTELGTHFRSLIARQKETDSARCSESVMKMMSDMLDSAPIITTIWNTRRMQTALYIPFMTLPAPPTHGITKSSQT